MFKKILGLTALVALFVFPFTAQAAVIGSLSISPTTVNQSGNLAISGSCGASGSNANVTFRLNNNGSITNVGSAVMTNASGDFSTNVFVPSGYIPGTSTVEAVCSNGDLVTSPVTVNVPIGSTVNINGTPTLGQALTVSGTCGTTAVGSAVNISLVRSIGSVNLGSTTTTSANGDFSGTFNVPTNAGGGPVTVVASCPTGNVSVNSSIVDPNANLNVSDTSPNAGGTVTVNGVCDTLAGRAISFMLSSPSRQATLNTGTTGTNGAFAATLNIPEDFPVGNATLVMFCPTGNLVTANLVIDPAVSGNGSTTGGAATGTGSSTGTSTTPVGGVAAGKSMGLGLILALVMIGAGVSGLALKKRVPYDSNVL